MVRHHKFARQTVGSTLDHLVVRVEDRLARFRRGAADDQIERRGLAHEVGEALREGGVAEALGGDLVGRNAGLVVAHVVDGAHRRA